jgi:hypothetical protein
MKAGLAGMGDKWKRHTLAPRKNPKDAAAKAAGAWKSGVQAAIAADSFKQGVAAIDLEEMAATIEATPDSAVAEGVARREAKVRRVQSALARIQEEDAKLIDAMPADTDVQRKARMDKQYELGKTVKTRLQKALATA